jgi:hypothetical protein
MSDENTLEPLTAANILGRVLPFAPKRKTPEPPTPEGEQIALEHACTLVRQLAESRLQLARDCALILAEAKARGVNVLVNLPGGENFTHALEATINRTDWADRICRYLEGRLAIRRAFDGAEISQDEAHRQLCELCAAVGIEPPPKQ